VKNSPPGAGLYCGSLLREKMLALLGAAGIKTEKI